MKVLFWLLIAVDTAALGFFFVLGLAAATSTRQSGFAVAFSPPFLIPALVLIGAVLLFTRSPSPLLRSIALLLAASPALILFVTQRVSMFQLQQNMNSKGELTSFREGPMREIADAIRSNDTATVARLAPTVDVNSLGYMNTSLLMVALRQLEKVPNDFTNLRTLIKAGANPNLESGREFPLEVAIQQSSHSGAEPTVILLKAGANPNTKTQWGDPLFFGGANATAPVEVMAALLDNGADVKLTDKDGKTVLIAAANTGNWKAARLLLDRGVDYKVGRSLSGESFEQMVQTATMRTWGDTAGAAAIAEYLKRK